MRRGRKSANTIWGNSSSVLVGDFLFARSFNLMVETGDLMVLDILARAASVIAEGEVMQLAAANDAETDARALHGDRRPRRPRPCLRRRRSRAPWRLDGPASEATALETYGRELGSRIPARGRRARLWRPSPPRWARTPVTISEEGKVTLPVVFARDAGDESERAFWRRVVGIERSEDDFHSRRRADASAQCHRTHARRPHASTRSRRKLR